jgi:CheY-like chemotaxis protein
MSKRILVVEDQPDNRQIIRDMLAPTDYEITEVRCAAAWNRLPS